MDEITIGKNKIISYKKNDEKYYKITLPKIIEENLDIENRIAKIKIDIEKQKIILDLDLE